MSCRVYCPMFDKDLSMRKSWQPLCQANKKEKLTCNKCQLERKNLLNK